jgi:hypothetical protein
MYRHPRVMRVMGEAEQILFDLFARYQKSPGDLPAEWVEATARDRGRARRRIGNFIAGMTDRFALTEHQGFLTRPRICVRRRPGTEMAEKPLHSIFLPTCSRACMRLRRARAEGNWPAGIDFLPRRGRAAA